MQKRRTTEYKAFIQTVVFEKDERFGFIVKPPNQREFIPPEAELSLVMIGRGRERGREKNPLNIN